VAGLGGLHEALKIVEPLRDGAKMPPWLFWARLVEVYSNAKLPDQVIACSEKAVELAPDNATVLVDLAMVLLRYRRDTRRARELLEEVRGHALGDMVEPFVLKTEGVLALEEGDAAAARRLLEESILKMSPYARANALVGATIAQSHAYLTLACAGLSDADSAHTHFRLAEPRLRALKADDLLARCQQALGQ
jgi:tetratricopeptide (TPR) repeat protein